MVKLVSVAASTIGFPAFAIYRPIRERGGEPSICVRAGFVWGHLALRAKVPSPSGLTYKNLACSYSRDEVTLCKPKEKMQL
jgi:hypothetical protein